MFVDNVSDTNKSLARMIRIKVKSYRMTRDEVVIVTSPQTPWILEGF